MVTNTDHYYTFITIQVEKSNTTEHCGVISIIYVDYHKIKPG